MIWEKLNINEVKYYCTSQDVDFVCLPFSCQVEKIIQIFYYYGIVEFEIKYIKEFYKKLQLVSPKSDKVINPRPSKIQKVLENIKGIQSASENHYKISNLNIEDIENYALDIKQGYSKNAIMYQVFFKFSPNNSIVSQIITLKKLVPNVKKMNNAELINYAKNEGLVNIGAMYLNEANKLIARGKAEGLIFSIEQNKFPV